MNWYFLTTRGNFTQIFGPANYVLRAQSLSIKLYPIHHNDFVNNRIVWSGKWKALFLSEEPGTKVVLENSLKVDKNQLWQIHRKYTHILGKKLQSLPGGIHI